MTLRIGDTARGAQCAEQRLTYERQVDEVGDAVGSRLQVDLIGGVAVRIDGEQVALRPGLDRLIVARLAIAAGSRVSAVRLIDDLWADPPAGAGATLRVYLSRLRQGPLSEVLVGGRGGYALAVHPDAVDVIRLRRLLSSTDAGAEPPVALAPALESWGHGPLAELDEAPFFRAVADELEGLREAATVAVATRLIEHGDAHSAAALLRALPDSARDDDATMMLTTTALARAGRREEAIRLLDARSGAAGDDVLNAHREALIRGDGIRRGGGPVRNGIPRPLTPLVGRQAELAAIEQARLRSPLVTVVGPGGVGKTRLAVESVWRTAAPIDTEQWFVDLTTVDGSRSVLDVVARPSARRNRRSTPSWRASHGRPHCC